MGSENEWRMTLSQVASDSKFRWRTWQGVRPFAQFDVTNPSLDRKS